MGSKLIPVTFIKRWRGYAEGSRGDLKREVAEELLAGGYIEAEIPAESLPASGQQSTLTTSPLTPGGTVVEYDLQEVVESLQASLAQKEDELAVSREQIIVLENKLKEANATIAKLSGKPSEESVVTAPTPTPKPPTEGATLAEEVSWENQPVAASSAIPSSLKGLLLQNQIALMGDLARAVDENSLITIDGIGEAKAADLKGVIDALRSE